MKKFQFIILIVFVLASCDFPLHYFAPAPACNTKGTQLNYESALAVENQNLLRNELKNKEPQDYRYFFQTFIKEGGNTYMVTNFRNHVDCFDIKILVDKWDKLGGMLRTNGFSYPNELYDLKWEITTKNGMEEVLYMDMHRIID